MPSTAVDTGIFQDSWVAEHNWRSACPGSQAAGSGLGPRCLTDGAGILRDRDLARNARMPGRVPHPPALHQQRYTIMFSIQYVFDFFSRVLAAVVLQPLAD